MKSCSGNVALVEHRLQVVLVKYLRRYHSIAQLNELTVSN